MHDTKKALFPGTFNPFHGGHNHVVKKAAKIFSFVYVVVCNNPEKKCNISLETRLQNVKERLTSLSNVAILANKDKLTANLAKELGCNYLVRSARANTDYKYELELAAANKVINSKLETVLIIPDYSKIFYRSRLLKQTKQKNNFLNKF